MVACVAGKLALCQRAVDVINNALQRLPRKSPVYAEHIEKIIIKARFETWRDLLTVP